MNPPTERPSAYPFLLWGWVGLILFSSTNVAGGWANALFSAMFEATDTAPGLTRLLMQKGVHVVLFGVLGFLLVWAAPSRSTALGRAVRWSFAIGALSETLQLAFASRGPSIADVLLNGISGSLAAWMFLRLAWNGQKRPARASGS